MWLFSEFDKDYIEIFKKEYFPYVEFMENLNMAKIGKNVKKAVREIHKTPNKVSPRAFNHFCSIHEVIRKESSIVFAADETGRGRPAFARRVAKNMFKPSLNLASEKTYKKLMTLSNNLDVGLDVDRDLLIKYIEQFQVANNFKFQLTDKIDKLDRKTVRFYLNVLKGLLG